MLAHPHTIQGKRARTAFRTLHRMTWNSLSCWRTGDITALKACSGRKTLKFLRKQSPETREAWDKWLQESREKQLVRFLQGMPDSQLGAFLSVIDAEILSAKERGF